MWIAVIIATLLIAGCAAVPIPEPDSAPLSSGVGTAVEQGSERGGALRHEQISISLPLGAVELRVTPLDEKVLRLTAPDVRRRLLNLALDRQPAAADPRTSFLVTFTASIPDQLMLPADLRFEVGGRRLEISEIIPVTTGWGEQRLRVREPQAAVFVLREWVDPFIPLRISYGHLSSDGWREIITLLRAEERRVVTTGGTIR